MTLSEYYCESPPDTHSISPKLMYSMLKFVYVNTFSHDKMISIPTLCSAIDYQFLTHVEHLSTISSTYIVTFTNNPSLLYNHILTEKLTTY